MRVGNDLIQIYPKTAKGLAGSRLESFAALKIVRFSAWGLDETVSVAIGLPADGRLAILEGTPERRQQWQVQESE